MLPELIPKTINKYYEPFLGSASIFFEIKPSIAILNDVNKDLMITYRQVKSNVDGVIKSLSTLRNTKTNYYKVRSSLPRRHSEKAARFIYLNQTCFNGIYRVNKQGKFNVPYGYRKIDFVRAQNLKLCSKQLRTAELMSCDFISALSDVERGDFVFLDPPYTVAHSNNGFIEYNKRLFTWEDQQRLAELTASLHRKGINFILTNANHQSIYSLYQRVGKSYIIDRYSTVSSYGHARNRISELIISNCL
jgi:DNA adenine methylase